MKGLFIFLLLVGHSFCSLGQNFRLDSLKKVLENESEDTSKVLTLLNISKLYTSANPNIALSYAQSASDLSKKIDYTEGYGQATNIIANLFYNTGNYVKALETQFELLKMWERVNDSIQIGASYNTIALVYSEQRDFKNALIYFFKAKQIFEALMNNDYTATVLLNIGDNYEKMDQLDSALYFENQAYELALRINDSDDLGMILTNLGNIQYKMHNNEIARSYFKLGVTDAFKANDYLALSEAEAGISKIFKDDLQIDSSIAHAKHALNFAVESSDLKGKANASMLLSELFNSKKQTDSSFFYYREAVTANDSMSNAEIVRRMQVMSTNEQLRQQEIASNKEKEAMERKNNLQMLAIAIFITIIFSILMFLSKRKYKHKSLRYLGLLTLLLLFEFISFLIYPYIAKLSHEIPAVTLILSVTIAAILVPVHHKLEHWVDESLTRKTRRSYKPRKSSTIKKQP